MKALAAAAVRAVNLLAMTLLGAGLAGAPSARAQGAQGVQGVQFSGSMGTKALLVIDGKPRTLAVGDTHAGVRLLALGAGQAQVERDGRVLTLSLGGVPVALAGEAAASGAVNPREVVLKADAGGHFVADGAINGRPVKFMVDTGATTITMSQTEAERLGLDWRAAPRAQATTANGAVPVNLLNLPSVRLAGVTVSNVAAIVLPAQLPFILLGNSFLGRFQMRRDNDVMRLELKP